MKAFYYHFSDSYWAEMAFVSLVKLTERLLGVSYFYNSQLEAEIQRSKGISPKVSRSVNGGVRIGKSNIQITLLTITV